MGALSSLHSSCAPETPSRLRPCRRFSFLLTPAVHPRTSHKSCVFEDAHRNLAFVKVTCVHVLPDTHHPLDTPLTGATRKSMSWLIGVYVTSRANIKEYKHEPVSGNLSFINKPNITARVSLHTAISSCFCIYISKIISYFTSYGGYMLPGRVSNISVVTKDANMTKQTWLGSLNTFWD